MMKRYIILILLVSVLFGVSTVYKYRTFNIFRDFPIKEIIAEKSNNKILLLFFFSINSCAPCLDIIDVLNNLDARYKVVGIVREKELEFVDELRRITGAKFELKSNKSIKKYSPIYAPTLYGISRKGEILFILPSVPGESNYIKEFLEVLLRRANNLL